MRAPRLAVLAASLGFLLACGGLPLPGSDDGSPVVLDEDAQRIVDELIAADPGAPTLEETFSDLDPAEAPPTRPPACPAGATQVRYPRGEALEIYCSASDGRKSGPWGRWVGQRVTETRDYVDGELDGRVITWSKGRKRTERHFLAGVAHGEEASWDAEGELLTRGENRSGARHGRWILNTPGEEGPAFGGACFLDGVEAWTTTDPAELTTRGCAPEELAQNG